MIRSAQQAAAYARGEVTEGFVEHPAVMDEMDEHGPFPDTVDRQVTMLVARLAELACKEPLSRVNQVDLHTILGSEALPASDSLDEARRCHLLELAIDVHRHSGGDEERILATSRLFERYLDQG